MTSTGKTRVLALATPDGWARDLETARILQLETQECLSMTDRDGLWGPLRDLADPAVALENLDKGAVLEVADFALLRRWLYAVDSWVQVPRDEIRGERIKKAIQQLPDPMQPLRVLDKILTPEGELSERASPRLQALHNEIRGLKREISIILDNLLKTYSTKGVLQEAFSDVRDGRFVIPVKISHQGDVEGMIYESSASRQTVFVEPKEVAPLNNRLRQRQGELIQEIFAILKDTSEKMKPYSGEIRLSVEILSHWDAVHAKARIGRTYGGKPLTISDERVFVLYQTAHPLLWWSLPHEKIIRNDIEFGEPARTLLLTGPNTGGKTVLLKTLGFAGLCGRTGFPFPAVEHPQVPFIDAFFADLGDAQSIEQHVSSFSGHVMRFKEILESVTENSLVLLDELNAATDPQEGAALSRAFLETVMARGAIVVSTTHDPNLKVLAYSNSSIVNASMAFDEGARTPTYRMVVGVPGRSRALETAERLGIPRDVLDLAKSYLTAEHSKFEDLLSRLESHAAEAQRSRNQAVNLREEAERLKKEWTERTEASVGEMMERTRLKLKRILEQAQDEVRSTVRKLDDVKNRRDIDQARAAMNQFAAVASSRVETALKEEAPHVAEALEKKSVSRPVDGLPEVAVGSIVRIPKWKNTGVVLEMKGGKVKVAMGNLQMSLSMQDVEPLTASEAKLAASSSSNKARAQRAVMLNAPPTPPSKIDIRGKRFDDAMSELEQYLDQAFRSGGMAEVTIVHGLGTGALREGAKKLIAGLPYVKEFRDGGAGAGGTGATIVEFER